MDAAEFEAEEDLLLADMDAADASASEGTMIALLPTTTDWCKQDLPHMTLVYAGLISEHKPTAFNELAKDAASIALLSSPLILQVVGVDVFGEEEKVNVLKLQPSSEVLAMRRVVEHWNASQFPFRPHVTIGPYMLGVDIIPHSIIFDRIYVGWGDENLTFWLRR